MAASRSSQLTATGRWIAVVVMILAASPLVAAMMMQPAAEGHGTHRQLGLPACGWQVSMGIPCPTCGMTTSFSHVARGDYLTAAIVQPAGMMLSILVAMTVVASLWAAVTGAPMQRFLAGALRPGIVWFGVGILMLAWVWTLLRAGGLAT
ncbi:MAG: DUF2752 domain-containing protein [Phycisphaerales bacterium]|nr:DUF2752 domain-containing protein [Phycisphaerales bacterium]